MVACDRLGIASVWLMDHLHPPGLPRVPSFEAWTAATALAAATERIRIGHLVLANGFRHPAVLAKMAVTLDHASGGRLEIGLGSGSYAPEFKAYGMPFPGAAERAGRLDEALAVLRKLFTEPASSFEGRFYRLDGAPSLPRPVQQPHPPIHVGGAGERWTLPVVAKHADVWNCPTYALADLPRKRTVLQAECVRIGRDPAAVEVSEEAVLALAPSRDRVGAVSAVAERRFAGPGWGLAAGGYVGLPDTVVTRIRERVALGVRRFVFFLHDRGEPETLALLAREVVPAVAAL